MATIQQTPLPSGFEDLYALTQWALPNEKQRNAKRLASTMPEIHEFYATMHAELERISEFFNGKQMAALSEAEQNLLNMALSLMEVSACIELFSSVQVPLATSDSQLVIEQ